MSILDLAFAFLIGQPTDAVALRDTARAYLTADTAAEHLTAARFAGAVYEVDPDLLLSIAWHESRYSPTAVTPEAGHKISCGVMTPEPTRDIALCSRSTSSLTAGYLAGARHLRAWILACRDNLHCAFTGYAGGYYLIAACKRDATPRACDTWDVFLSRAAMIRNLRDKRRRGVSS